MEPTPSELVDKNQAGTATASASDPLNPLIKSEQLKEEENLEKDKNKDKNKDKKEKESPEDVFNNMSKQFCKDKFKMLDLSIKPYMIKQYDEDFVTQTMRNNLKNMFDIDKNDDNNLSSNEDFYSKFKPLSQ